MSGHAPLVRRIAHHMMRGLPSSVAVDDIIQAGMIGLLDAAGRYDDLRGAQFETFAAQRIRGAMLDELRQADHMPRGWSCAMRRIGVATSKLQQRLGRQPGEADVAQELGMPLTEYRMMRLDLHNAQLVPLEDDFDMAAEQEESPQYDLELAIEALPARLRGVIDMRYKQEMTLREIGEVFGVSGATVFKIHAQAISRLHSALVAR